MSFAAAAWAIRQSPSTQTDKLVLIALCDCYNTNNSRCDPSNAHLAESAMCSPRYISDSLDRLEKEGFISIARRPGRRNNYEILFVETEPADESKTPELSSEVQPLTPELSSETPELSSPEPIRTYQHQQQRHGFNPSKTTLDRLRRNKIHFDQATLDHYRTHIEEKIACGEHVTSLQSGFITWCKREMRYQATKTPGKPSQSKSKNLYDLNDRELLKLCKQHSIGTHGRSTKELVEKLRAAM